MSLLPQQTNANDQLTYFIKATGQQLNISTVNADNVNANKLSTGTAYVGGNLGVGGDFYSDNVSTNSVSTNFIYADAGTISTFSTFEIVLDSQTLNASATELLLNGVPIATTSNLSSIADWSYDPAVSTVQMAGNDLNAAGTVSSLNVRAGNGFFQNLIAYNALFVSTQTSTISSLLTFADVGTYSTLNAGSANISSLDIYNVSATTAAFSSLTVTDVLSTPSLYVSSINGSEFTSTGITVQVAGVSSLVANSISSIGAEIRQALVSSLVFAPSLNPSLGGVNVNLGLGSILGNVIGWGAGVFGAAAGIVGLGTGIAALSMGRQQDFIDNSRYELINGTTQLQFSTLGSVTSSIYRASDSVSPDQIPGSTIYLSTILPAGTLAVRSVSDPLNTVSTPYSTIQAFGPWSAVPPELTTSSFAEIFTSSLQASSIQTLDANVSSVVGLSSINGKSIAQYENLSSFEWAEYPAISTISFSTSVAAIIQSGAPATDNIALVGSNIQLIGAHTDAKNLLLASTISTAVVLGANDNLFGVGGIRGLKLDAEQLFFSTTQTNITGLINCSTIDSFATNTRFATASTVTTSSLQLAQQGAFGLSSILFVSTAALPGFGTSSCLVANTDFSVGQNDIYAQQIRLGYLNPSSQPSEIIFHSPNNTQRAFNLGNSDQTIRIQSTANATTAGYLLDTQVNPPFFSTINAGTSTALFAYFPSTTANTIGVSTLSVVPNPIFVAATASLSSQKVLAANTPLALDLGSATVNVGGYTIAASTLTVPVAGTYQLTPSIQFNTTTGGAQQVDFWITKNGADLLDSASRISVANNAEQIGTVVIYDTAAANDKYGIKIASGDANMTAAFFQSTVATPYTRPAIPAIILNAQRIA